ncbi:ribonuclease III domain-containing protein [Phascolomyces articulosus]|uniref:Ribonuclease III domain-containing protein n=1 Tax=Phascolomyces articulosus TaxID=60185 RepID=A0AAD5K128_9FUNG|nr:ribonuclease III domain-containing protein [Phascolomyces articulosus]
MLRTIIGRQSFHSSAITRVEKKASPEFSAESVSQRLGVSFITPDILQRALTHKSFKHGSIPTNERLTALGGRVISLFATEKAFQNNAEDIAQQVGEHTNQIQLASVFDTLNLEPGLQYDLRDGATTKVKADAYRAVVGAIYHDKGFSTAREFVQKHL